MANADALRCIEIITERTALTASESLLLKRIINDIRVEFDLEGAVHPTTFEDGSGGPPKEWLW